MDAESLVKELILKSMTPEQQEAILASVKTSVANARAIQKQKIGENVDLVVQALKKIESDIRSRYDDLGNLIEKRVASIQDGRDGINGTDGRDGRDGKPGKDGAMGRQGAQGPSGKDGIDGIDGVSIENAYLDFDGGLVIKLSNGNEINVGEIMPMELASQIKVITNGGGTSQYVLDTLASLQTQINTLIPSQTGNSGKYLTTNGTTTSWGSIAGGGLSYQGTWNASTNTPTLASSTGVNGYYYIVATAGSTNLNGISDWQIGDWLLFNGSVWQKIDQSELVTSVAGRTGAVTLSFADISGTLAVANGGTGATTTAGALTSLGAYAASNPSGYTSNTGTVTSVAASVPTFLSVTGSPVTTSGTLAISYSGTALPVANGGTGVTTSTGTGNTVLSTSPTLVTPILGTPTSATLTNATGLPLTTGVTGTLPIANGGTGTATPSIVAGTNITVTGTWPNQTIASSGSSATPIVQNLDQVTSNQTIASGSNGFSVGPMTIASGFSVTVASGQRYVII